MIIESFIVCISREFNTVGHSFSIKALAQYASAKEDIGMYGRESSTLGLFSGY